VLSEITDSDIAEMMLDKYTEIDWINYDRAILMKGQRGENRQMVDLIYNDYVEDVHKIIVGFKYELKMRNPRTKDTINFVEKLASAKSQINIVNLIEYTAWIKLNTGRRLNKCPFPSHKDGTASFKVYVDTNTFYCFGCKQWGDIVHFVEYLTNCSRSDAMKKIISFNE